MPRNSCSISGCPPSTDFAKDLSRILAGHPQIQALDLDRLDGATGSGPLSWEKTTVLAICGRRSGGGPGFIRCRSGIDEWISKEVKSRDFLLQISLDSMWESVSERDICKFSASVFFFFLGEEKWSLKGFLDGF